MSVPVGGPDAAGDDGEASGLPLSCGGIRLITEAVSLDQLLRLVEEASETCGSFVRGRGLSVHGGQRLDR